MKKKPQPVAWMHTSATGQTYFRKNKQDAVFKPKAVYLEAPTKEWQGITEDEADELLETHMGRSRPSLWSFMVGVEEKLKSKNA
jgi:hypothetical protein